MVHGFSLVFRYFAKAIGSRFRRLAEAALWTPWIHQGRTQRHVRWLENAANGGYRRRVREDPGHHHGMNFFQLEFKLVTLFCLSVFFMLFKNKFFVSACLHDTYQLETKAFCNLLPFCEDFILFNVYGCFQK